MSWAIRRRIRSECDFIDLRNRVFSSRFFSPSMRIWTKSVIIRIRGLPQLFPHPPRLFEMAPPMGGRLGKHGPETHPQEARDRGGNLDLGEIQAVGVLHP